MSIVKGRYELHERLGEGGMAIVYRARQLNLDREVAVKFIKADVMGKGFMSRFEREARAIGQLNHPNITQVYDFDTDEQGRPFLVMERLLGMDLAVYLLNYAPLRLGDVLTVMRGVGSALQFAHARNIIHRDVKPSNIFITIDQQVKLMDFGLAKYEADGGLTQSGAAIGTPKYFSPEQAAGKSLDQRTDIYALGVIFYELLTGQRPYEGDNIMNLVMQHATAPIPDPRDLRPELPPFVTNIVMRMMAKDRDERYADMGEVLADLDKIEVDAADSGTLPRPVLLLSRTDTLRPAPETVVFSTPSLSMLSSTLMQRSVRLPLPLVLVAVLALLGIGAAFALTRSGEGEETPEEVPSLSVSIAPATAGEYLVLVADWQSNDATYDRRIAETLRSSSAVGISPNTIVRVETIDRRIGSSEEARALAQEVNAHLVVWGVLDEVGLEVIFEDIHGEPRSADVLRFVVPNNDDFNDMMAVDMPYALGYYLSSMLMHHFVRTSDIDGIASSGLSSSGGSPEADLRIVSPSDLDAQILSLYGAASGQAGPESVVAAISAALRLVPGDPTLYFLRSYYEAFLLGNLARARADVESLRELLGDANVVIWSEMNIALFEEDYVRILELSEGLDTSVPGYGLPFSYRQTALAMSGDFTQIQAEIQGEVIEQEVLGLPFWDGLLALTYEIQGDTARLVPVQERVYTNRDLEASAGFVSSATNTPIGFYLLGGYLGELTEQMLPALVAYQAGLARSPENYLLHWRRAALALDSEDGETAYTHLSAAREFAPVPFPIATYQLAGVIYTFPDDIPADAPPACEMLAEAQTEAETQPDFYAPLLTTISETAAEWGCEERAGG